MHTRLYSLKTDLKGKSILSFDLGLCIVDEKISELTIKINEREYTLQKREWLNTMKIWDDGKTFFLVCSKHVNQKYAFDILMKHAINKIDKRIESLLNVKEKYQRELAA